MKPIDLLLLHPPTTFQNPTGLGLQNMIAASVPSTAVFEIYPLGFLSIGEYLERHGYHVAICNLALLNSVIPGLRPDAIIRRMRARVVGIDLHWAAHTSGVLELAHIIKNIYSDIKIVVGGLTASCFWQEVLDYPEIDFVIRGDSAEYPFLCLLNIMKNGGKFEEVPNLSWRDNRGEIQTNGLDWVPENIDDYRTDYSWIIRSAARHHDPISLLMSIPYRDWIMNPSAAVITQRGCSNNCFLCGGSAFAYLNICNRRRPAIKSPAAVVRDVVSAARIMRGPIFLGSDMQDPGQDYYREVFRRYRSLQIENPLTIEVIQPAPFEFYKTAVESCSSATLHMSADSHDETLRMQFGRKYTNDSLEQTIGAALDAGFKTVRIFFGIGLPGQTEVSVMETVDYCGELLNRFGHNGRFFPFISVLAPYIEPGSLAFDDPERYMYKNFYSTLKDYRRSIRQHSWAQTIGYETFDMDRITLVDVTYRATIELNRILEKNKLMSRKNRLREEERLKKEWHAIQENSTSQTRWLVGESSIYTSRVRGFHIKPYAFRPLGILREACAGIHSLFCDLSAGEARSVWRLIV